MELKDVKGIGTKSLALLNKLGIYTVNDLSKNSLKVLKVGKSSKAKNKKDIY